jgi:hypothetical protein
MADNSKNIKQENTEFRDQRDLLREINSELGKKVNNVKDASSAYTSLQSIADKLAQDEENLVDLSDKQLNALRAQAAERLRVIQESAKQLAIEKGIGNLNGAALDNKIKTLLVEKQLTEQEASLLRGKAQGFQLEKETLDLIDKRIEKEKTVNKAVGLTGAALKASGEAMDKLGLGALKNNLNFEQAANASRKMAQELTNGGTKAATLGDRVKIIGAGVGELAKGLKNSLFSFEAIFALVVTGLVKGSQSIADFRKETGMSYTEAYKLRTEMSGVALASNDNYITSEKLQKAYSSMTTELGFAADVLGGEALVSATNLQERLGFSAKESATLVVNARLQGKATEDVLDSNVKVVGEFNKQNKTAFNVKEIMKEAASASKGFQASVGFSNDKLMAAAAAAKKLGLNLGEVEKISDSLLDFESSITAELEAELLTGKDINLEKERLLALNGDLEGLSKSLTDNAAVQDAFASKNVVQQNALAKSLGLNRDELAKIALQQKFNNLSAEEFKSRYGEATYESLKTRSATEKFQDSLAKITSVLGDILALFTPILDLISLITSNSITLGVVLGVIALTTLPKILSGIKSMYGGIKGAVKESASLFTGKGKKAAETAGDSLGKTADKTKGLSAQAGKGIKDWLTNLGKGLKALANAFKAIGPAGFAYLAAGLALLTGAVIGLGFALKLAAPGLEAIGKIIGTVFKGVAEVITAVADGFVKLLGAISLEKATAVIALGGGLSLLGVGLVSFAGGLAAATAIMAVGGLLGNPLDMILEMASQADAIKSTADSLTQMAAALAGVSSALSTIDTDKLESLGDFATENAFANAATGIVSAITAPINAIGNAIGGGSKDESAQKLDEIKMVLQELLKKEGSVYIDGAKAGRAFTVGTYNLQ